MISKWKKLSDQSIFKNGIVHIIEKEFYYSVACDSMPFTIVKMSNWATIVPITKNGEFIIVRQFRAGPELDTLEFPGGAINKDENPLDAANRELLEETGAIAEKFTLLSAMDPNPAFMDNKCYVFLAENAHITNKQKLDKFEDNEVLIVNRDKLISLIQQGEFRQSISLAALALYNANK